MSSAAASSNSPTKTPEWGGRTSPDARGNTDWWPNTLSLGILHQGHPRSNPFGTTFDYAEAFEGLDVEAMTRDLDAIMTDSQEWWPADWGHYGPFFIRMAWHAAGTYRITDGRGGGGTGAQRYAPLNSWPDNGNLDKARRLLLPIKQKYGKHLSWADLFLYTGNRALETMGFTTFGFGFGRADIWAPEDDIYWGPEAEWLATEDERYTGSFETEDRVLDNPLAAVQMGLIYVNPEGPNGIPDALKSAQDIRETFARMAMNDRETVALTVGGHTFGKMHGAAPDSHHGAAPEGARIQDQGLGWASDHETGLGAYTITSGLEGAWTPTPTQWDNSYLDTLMGHEWELVQSPAGANQWEPKSVRDGFMVPDAHIEGRENKPVMSTADMAMVADPAYLEICEEFQANPDVMADAFARAWFKLTHRDMGPIDRYLGPLVPDEELIWQDPVPAVDHELVGSAEVEDLTRRIMDSGLSISQLVSTAWASASTFRRTDYKGGANGARIRLEPMAGWDVHVRSGVGQVIAKLDEVRQAFNDARTADSSSPAVRISLADMIVLGGTVAVEQAARAAGHDLELRFTPGRTDATQDMTDVEATSYLEPRADGFRNYAQKGGGIPTEHLLVDKAFMLGLSAPEMAALVGGLRVLGANAGDDNDAGVLTDRPGQLTNDFFVNLLDMDTVWEPVGEVDEAGEAETFRGVTREGGEQRWTASRVDLVFGSNAQLRAITEEYGADTGTPDFLAAFASGWDRVMTNDRFDVA